MNEFGDPSETWTIAVEADTTQVQQEFVKVSNLGRQFSNTLISAFEGIAIKGRSVGDVLKSLALRLSELVLKAALKPLEQGFNNALSGLVSSGFGFANGGVISQGSPVPFAKGGVIQSPIAFPLSGGRAGIAGERGAEAILPLARGADGRLGVAASGSGGGGMQITINVTTPDADSFRRSETQLGAMLSRVVSMGRRNL
jgi:phage-related minor tail protein